MEKNKTNSRPPFVSGWLLFSLGILLACIAAPIQQGDAVTWIVWGACVALVVGGRSYQYFIQRR